MLVVPHGGGGGGEGRGGPIVYKPDVSGGVNLLSMIGECGNVGFPSRFGRTGNLLISLPQQSQSAGHSEHVFVYPMYQLSVLVVPPDCLLRELGHALVVILARVPGQLVSDGIASPVVLGNSAVVLVLLRPMSWDPLNTCGFDTPGSDGSPRIATNLRPAC